VLDENDWSPEWRSLEYKGAVLESAKSGDPVFVLPPLLPPPSRQIYQPTSAHANPDGEAKVWSPHTRTFGSASQQRFVAEFPSIRNLSKFEHLIVTATDRDAGVNGRVSYSVPENSPSREFFDVDPVTGKQI